LEKLFGYGSAAPVIKPGPNPMKILQARIYKQNQFLK